MIVEVEQCVSWTDCKRHTVVAGIVIVEGSSLHASCCLFDRFNQVRLPFADQLLVFTTYSFVSNHACCPLSSTELRCNTRSLRGHH